MTQDTKTEPSRALSVPVKQSETTAEALARLALWPESGAGLAVARWARLAVGECDLEALIELISRQAQGWSRDLGAEHLASQALTLGTVFQTLMVRGAASIERGEDVTVAETFIRLGLRAQTQARQSIEALAALQALTVVEEQNQPNELLDREERHGERLDSGAQEEASRSHTPLEAVG